jgi:hypothetical protein
MVSMTVTALVGSDDQRCWISSSGERLHFRPVVAAAIGQLQLRQRRMRQFRRHRHASALPARHGAARTAGAAHVGRHLVQPHEFQDAPGKQK